MKKTLSKLSLSALILSSFLNSNAAYAYTATQASTSMDNHQSHKYIYNFPKILSCNCDIHFTGDLLKTAYAHDNFQEISNLIQTNKIKFDVSDDYLLQELNIFAVKAITVEQPNLALNIAKSYNPKHSNEVIGMGIIAKAMISQGYTNEASNIIDILFKNDQHDKATNKALASIAKRAAYTPGAEPLAFDIEKNRSNIDKKTIEDINNRKISYDKNIWHAKILFMDKSNKLLEKEIADIIGIYDAKTKDGRRKLTILVKDALRAGRLDIATNIINKILLNSPDDYRSLGSIAKSAIYIHGAIPIAVDIASKLGNTDSYSLRVRELVEKIALEHINK